jgi:hypothetical protein
MPYKNKLEQKRNHARWRKRNPDKVRATSRRDYRAHRKARIAASRRWEKKNSKRVKTVRMRWYRKNKKKKFARERLWRHNMTQQQHDAVLKNQNNRCAVCRKIFKETPDIDHCHKTKKIRGLLCSSCNLGLGHFKDDVQFLLSAIKYLKGFASAHA